MKSRLKGGEVSTPVAEQSALVQPLDDVLSAESIDQLFKLADADGDGVVGDADARSFFLATGLTPAKLSKV
jgi:hypothetical protein